MFTFAKPALTTKQKIVVAFVLEKTDADEKALAALLGIEINQMNVFEYKNTATLLDGAKTLKSNDVIIDLLVYLSEASMGQQNSRALLQNTGAKNLLYFYTQAKSLTIKIDGNIATVQLPLKGNYLECHLAFKLAAKQNR